MHYKGNIIRPPSEADSIILQVTVGCSHNKCTFCGAYKDVRFHIKQDSILAADLEYAKKYCQRLKRVFLADGDALIIPQERLVKLFSQIREKLPWIRRISLYANAKSILRKSAEQLANLKALGLDRIYMGLESGHDETLAAIRKGADSSRIVKAGQLIKSVDLFLSVTVLLGVAGISNSLVHARKTAEALNAMAPNQIAALTLMLLENTPLYDAVLAGKFILPDTHGILMELKTMVEYIRLDKVQFQSNHASNYLSINARLQRDKPEVISLIEQALAGKIHLIPETQRSL